MSRIVIIEPHPDDAFLGCFTILNIGLIVDKIITVSDGSKELPSPTMNPKEYVELRRKEADMCTAYFGVGIDNRISLNFPDGELSHYVSEITETLNKHLQYRDTVFLPSQYEKNPDHKAVYDAYSRLNRVTFPRYYSIWNSIKGRVTSIPVNTEEKIRLFKKLFPSQKKLVTQYPNWNLWEWEDYK